MMYEYALTGESGHLNGYGKVSASGLVNVLMKATVTGLTLLVRVAAPDCTTGG